MPFGPGDLPAGALRPLKPTSFLKAPRKVPKTGDDTAASSLWVYVWRMSGWHQVSVCVIAVVVTLLNLIPIELQRRIVNEVVGSQDVALLVRFGIFYLSVILLHQVVKFGLRVYQEWLMESTLNYTRAHLIRIYGDNIDKDDEDSGRAVAIMGSEVEKLGGFVGEALSQAFANSATLIGVTVYMFIVEPGIALYALAVLVPQVLLTPVIQRKLNELVEERVTYMRDFGDTLSEMTRGAQEDSLGMLPRIFNNRMKFNLLKHAMKSVLNLFNAAGPATVLLYGGYLVMQGETEVGLIVAFISGFERLSAPVRELIGFYRVAAQAGVQHKMVGKWMEER